MFSKLFPYPTHLHIKYTQYEDRSPTLLINGKINISDISLKTKEKRPLFKLAKIDLSIGDSDVISKKFFINEINLKNPEIHLKRDENGEINFKKVIPPQKKNEKDKKEKTDDREPEVTIDNIRLKGGTLYFTDYYHYADFRSTLENIEFNLKNFKSKGDQPFYINTKMNINRTGLVSLTGSITLKPIDANMSLDLKSVAIKPFQTYFEDKVNILITDGYLNTKGKLNFKKSKNDKPSITFVGKLSLTDLKTIDKKSAQDFLKWGSLFLDGISIKTDPMDIKIENVSLADFYSRIVVNQDGTLNLQKIVVKEDKQEDKTEEKDKEVSKHRNNKPKIIISKITLQNGHINFTDLYIKPNYTADMMELTGRVTGLTTDENILGDVDIKGRFENYAPLEITGKINPLRKDLFVDLKVDFKGMDLSPLTPYSGKYLGYTIEKGKLFLDLKYYIEKKKISAQNKIFLDQFNLGDSVESQPHRNKTTCKTSDSPA